MSTPATEDPGATHAAGALDDDELRVLSKHATEQTYQKNAVIVNEGDQSSTIFIILAGRVKVFLRNSDGREMVINVLGPREYFGELVIDEGARSASIATLETCRFMIVTKTDFKALVISDPDFALKLINRLMQRVRALTDNIRSLALLDVYGRVARLLLKLAKAQGSCRNQTAATDFTSDALFVAAAGSFASCRICRTENRPRHRQQRISRLAAAQSGQRHESHGGKIAHARL